MSPQREGSSPVSSQRRCLGHRQRDRASWRAGEHQRAAPAAAPLGGDLVRVAPRVMVLAVPVQPAALALLGQVPGWDCFARVGASGLLAVPVWGPPAAAEAGVLPGPAFPPPLLPQMRSPPRWDPSSAQSLPFAEHEAARSAASSPP